MKNYVYLFGLSCVLSHSAFSREWESANGKKVDADLVSIKGDKITLKRNTDGKEFTVGKLFFSKEDQAYIEQQRALQVEKNPANIDEAPVLKKPVVEEENGNFGQKMPKLISLERDFKIVEIEEKSAENRFVYHSKNFEFISDVRLSKSAQKLFGELFETTLLYCQQLPISSMKAINQKADNKKNIYLYSDTEEYGKASTRPGSAGVYMSGRDIIMVDMNSLGLKKMGKGVTLERGEGNRTLPHEVVHMFTDLVYYKSGSRGWFTEGLSEYVAATPYRSGKYIATSFRRDLVKYVTAFADDGRGRNIGKEFTMPAIENFMLQSYTEFAGLDSVTTNKNYGIASLMVFYFFHLEEDGLEHLTNFLKALKSGKEGEEALKILLNGRTYRELEADIQKAWRSNGVKITFSEPKKQE